MFHRLPFFITVSCNYTSFHNTLNKSAGEYAIAKKENPLGGVIGLISTTDKIEIDFGKQINAKIFEYLFEPINGKYQPIGEVLRKVKNYFTLPNKQKYNVALIGDPAMRLAMPNHKIDITEVNGKELGKENFTATNSYRIKGYIRNQTYNGSMDIEVFGKKSEKQTLDNSRVGKKMKYSVQKPIYKAKTIIIEGHFEFNFIVPKDITHPVEESK